MIKKIIKKDIPQVLNDTNFWAKDQLPITKHRLWALYHNPESEEDDVIVYYLEKDEKIQAYLTIYHFSWPYNNTSIKLGTASSWYSNPEAMGGGFLLMRQALEDLDGNLISHMFNIHVKKLYEAMGQFQTIKEMDGLIYRFKKFNFFQKKKKENQIDQSFQKLSNNRITIETISFMDDSTYQFIKDHSENQFYPKSKAFFNWLLLYPWVLESANNDLEEKNKYQFSNKKAQFKQYAIKVFENNKTIGVLFYSIVNDQLKFYIRYSDDNNDQNTAVFLDILKLTCLQNDIKQMVCFDDDLNKSLQKDSFFSNTSPTKKLSIISNKFDISLFQNHKLNYGDGDVCFT